MTTAYEKIKRGKDIENFPSFTVAQEICSEALIIFGIHEYTVCFHEYPCLFIKFKDFTDKFRVS
jgi:hypothetical protein